METLKFSFSRLHFLSTPDVWFFLLFPQEKRVGPLLTNNARGFHNKMCITYFLELMLVEISLITSAKAGSERIFFSTFSSE